MGFEEMAWRKMAGDYGSDGACGGARSGSVPGETEGAIVRVREGRSLVVRSRLPTSRPGK